MIDAMTSVTGPEPAARILWHPDPKINAIVSGWRSQFTPAKGLALGFVADESFTNSVNWFLQDDIA